MIEEIISNFMKTEGNNRYKDLAGHWVSYYHSSPYFLMTGSLTEPMAKLTAGKSNDTQASSHHPTVVQGYLQSSSLEDSHSDLHESMHALTH